MGIYAADRLVLRRVDEIARDVRDHLHAHGVHGEELIDAAIHRLDGLLDAELTLWTEPDTAMTPGEIELAALELAATWICLERVRFAATALHLERRVAERWPAKLDAWRNNIAEVARLMGRETGDYGTALLYLTEYTKELIGDLS